MAKNNIGCVPDGRYRQVEWVIGEFQCPKCKKTFEEKIFGRVNASYLQSRLCPMCQREDDTKRKIEYLKKREKERKKRKREKD